MWLPHVRAETCPPATRASTEASRAAGLLLVLATSACGPGAVRPPPQVVALSEPAAWIAGRAGPVTLLTPPGADASSWQPGDAEAELLARADLIVGVGAGWEAWASTAALPTTRTVWLADGYETIARTAVLHAHADGAPHAHAGPEPHLWLDPDALLRGFDAIVARAPRADDAAHRSALQTALAAADEDLRGATSAWRGRAVAGEDTTFAYLARHLGVALVTPADTTSEAPVALWITRAAPELAGRFPAATPCWLDPAERSEHGAYDWLKITAANAAALRAAGGALPAAVPR